MAEILATIIVGFGYVGMATLFVLIAGFLSRAAIEFCRRKKTIQKFEEEEAEIWLP